MNQTSLVFSLFVHSFWAIAWENIHTTSVKESISVYINIFSLEILAHEVCKFLKK